MLMSCNRHNDTVHSDPNVSSQDDDATPVILASGEDHPAAISVDETSVYWIGESRSAIHRINKIGGTITSVVTGQQGIRRLFGDAEALYFLTDKQIKRVNKTGGDATTLFTFADLGPAEVSTWRLTIDKDNVYFVGGPGDDQLLKLRKAGGNPMPLTKIVMPTNLVSDGVNVYWADNYSEVKKVNVDGGEPRTIGECEDAAAVAVDSDAVYCSTSSGTIVRFAKTDGAMTTIGSVANAQFDQLAVDQNSVYALSVLFGIYRFDKKGGEPLKVVPINREQVSFVIDERYLFWSNYAQGTITRMRK